MAGRINRHGDSSHSASPDPRSKRRPERSRPPSSSPPKRSRKSENQKARERPPDPEKTRDSKYRTGRTERTDVEIDDGRRRDSRNAERERDREREKERLRDREREKERLSEREREKERLRDRERENDKERHRDRHAERTGLEKERAEDRDRDSGRKERRLGKEADRDKQGNVGTNMDKDGNSSRSKNRDKERHKEAEGKEGRPFSTSAGRTDSQKKQNRTTSPERAGKEIAVATRDEASKNHGEDLSLDGPEDSLAKMKAAEAAIEESHKEKETKEKPSFEYSGKLAAETNRVRGVTLLFNEPPEARKPTVRWRLYIFKDGEPLNEPLYIHRLSCYLFGRERRVADVPTDHPSCSKQHAVIQYRLVEREEEDGSQKSEVRPYLMDLGSTNGTFLNSERIESQRYYELFEKDTIKFGNSSREYVLLHEHSAG